jgi:hypothetical protein
MGEAELLKLVAGSVLNIIPSIFQGITGLGQMSEARRYERQYQRPTAEVTPATRRLVNYAYGRTLSQDIPGGELYRNMISGATAAGMRAASELGSGAEAYGALGRLVGGEQEAYSRLAAQTAQQLSQYGTQYMNVLPELAGEQLRVWNWNEAQPYIMAAETARQLRESGLRNVFSGMRGVFGTAAETVNPELNSSLFWGNNYSADKKGSVSDSDLNKAIEVLLNAIRG